jgi:hypothetical protein
MHLSSFMMVSKVINLFSITQHSFGFKYSFFWACGSIASGPSPRDGPRFLPSARHCGHRVPASHSVIGHLRSAQETLSPSDLSLRVTHWVPQTFHSGWHTEVSGFEELSEATSSGCRASGSLAASAGYAERTGQTCHLHHLPNPETK